MEKRGDAAKSKSADFEALSTYGKGLLDYLHNPQAQHLFSPDTKWGEIGDELKREDFWLFRIEALTFEEKAPRREAMENILGTFRGMDGISFIYLILGDKAGVKFYFGVAKEISYEGEQSSANTLGKEVLGPAIQGNFRGCSIKEV